MPAAPSASRIASARAKSLALRASARSASCSETSLSSASCSAESAPAPAAPPAAPSETHGSASGSKPNVSSIARTFTSASRTSAFATSESARSASFDSNVLPERIAVKIAAEAPETLMSSFIAATKSAGSASAEIAIISSRDGCSPTAAPARSMKFATRSYADCASASVWSDHSSMERYCTEPRA